MREKQLKYTDVEEMRVIPNDRHIAEHNKSDSTLSVQGNLLRSKVEERHDEWTKSWRIWI